MDDSCIEDPDVSSMQICSASGSFESTEFTDDLNSTALFTDLPSGLLDGVFDYVDLKPSAALRRVCWDWNRRLTSAYYFRIFHSSLVQFARMFGDECSKVMGGKPMQVSDQSAVYMLQRRTRVRKLVLFGKGSESLVERKPIPLDKLVSAIVKFPQLQTLTLHQHRLSTHELKQLIWSLPVGCVLCLKDVRIHDVDKYVLPPSWLFTRRSGFVNISDMVKVRVHGADKSKTIEEPANEARFAEQIVSLARRFADPMDPSELESIKNHLHRRFDVQGLETVVGDIIRLYEQRDVVYWNVIVLDVKALRPLTARLLEKLVLEIL
ncbi:hypothetical protein RvY_11198 [Ramazzottius varieornatus]|uniref:F-box domain-containing protein n=1 Tax=Ramazzottius varieornatus TaxID=947166 RepID=A0A1D1VHD9_RAMVA|nr:hypothetical protein RvY_11198 [Ramazzottius varieornatus]